MYAGLRVAVGTSSSPVGLGGDARVAFELSMELSKSASVRVFCTRAPGDADMSSRALLFQQKSSTFALVQVPGKERRSYVATYPKLTPKIVKSLWKALDDFSPHIIHLHDQGPVPLVLLLWARKHAVPLVFTCHTLPDRVLDFGIRALSPVASRLMDTRLFQRGYLDGFLRNASAIIALNASILESLKSYGTTLPPVFHISNGRFLSRFLGLSIPPVGVVPLRLIYVGVISARKNQKFLVEVMEHLPRDKFALDLVGAPLELDYARALEKYASSKNLPVTFVGPVPPEKVPFYLERSHFFLSASVMEVQSLAIIEALASGTPVVALPNETTLELVDSSVGYVFQEAPRVSPAGFADKLLELSNLSGDEYARFSKAARSRVSHLDWSSIAQQTLDVYEQLLKP